MVYHKVSQVGRIFRKCLVQQVPLDFIQLGLEEKPSSMEMQGPFGQCVTFFIMKRFLLGFLEERCNLSSSCRLCFAYILKAHDTGVCTLLESLQHVFSLELAAEHPHLPFSLWRAWQKGEPCSWWMLSALGSTPIINFLWSSSDLFLGISLFCTWYCLFML